DYFGGGPWEKEKGYLERSGLYHVKNVTTPTLILHGENDPRVPVTQGIEFYAALKRRGVKTQMVTYPRTQHGPQEPKFVQNIMERHISWVEEHVK
ncbi:MAG: prolyl oligopeptidase family serine peptidase, partial [Bryobacteraceae bacterium]|nr:prolyl oligopeptidase family serine peptidase [Bryobacteraceae bacterium]